MPPLITFKILNVYTNTFISCRVYVTTNKKNNTLIPSLYMQQQEKLDFSLLTHECTKTNQITVTQKYTTIDRVYKYQKKKKNISNIFSMQDYRKNLAR